VTRAELANAIDSHARQLAASCRALAKVSGIGAAVILDTIHVEAVRNLNRWREQQERKNGAPRGNAGNARPDPSTIEKESERAACQPKPQAKDGVQ
jgi:hypothetical protein